MNLPYPVLPNERVRSGFGVCDVRHPKPADHYSDTGAFPARCEHTHDVVRSPRVLASITSMGIQDMEEGLISKNEEGILRIIRRVDPGVLMVFVIQAGRPR